MRKVTIEIKLTEEDIRALHYQKYEEDGLLPLYKAESIIEDIIRLRLDEIKIDNNRMKIVKESLLDENET